MSPPQSSPSVPLAFSFGTTGSPPEGTAKEPPDKGGGWLGAPGGNISINLPQSGFIFSQGSLERDAANTGGAKPPFTSFDYLKKDGSSRGTPPMSFLQAVQGRARVPTSLANIKPPMLVEGEHVVDMDMEKLEKTKQAWGHCLHGKLQGANFNPATLQGRLQGIWRTRAPFHVIPLDDGSILFKFEDPEDMAGVQLGGPWFVGHYRLLIRSWSFEESEVPGRFNSVPLWIRMPKLPLQYWDNEILWSMAMAAGRPIKMDTFTASKASGRYARVCVEVDLDKPLARGARIRTPVGSHWQRFIYEDVQDLCNLCLLVGHNENQCKLKPAGDDPIQSKNSDAPMEEVSAGDPGQPSNQINLEWSVQFRSKKRPAKPRRAFAGEKNSTAQATGERESGKTSTGLPLTTKADHPPMAVGGSSKGDKPAQQMFGYRAIKPKRQFAERGASSNTNKETDLPATTGSSQRFSRSGNSFTALEELMGNDEGLINDRGRSVAGKGPAKNQTRISPAPTAIPLGQPTRSSGPSASPPVRLLTKSSQSLCLKTQLHQVPHDATGAPLGPGLHGLAHDPRGAVGCVSNNGALPGNEPGFSCSAVVHGTHGIPNMRESEVGALVDRRPASPKCDLTLDIDWEYPPNTVSSDVASSGESLELELSTMDEEALKVALVPFRLSGHKKKFDGKLLRNSSKGEDSNPRRAIKQAKVQNSR